MIKNIIKLLREKRNDLAHRGCLSMSFEEYNNSYIEIRAHVDLLESTINNIKPDVNCKWIRRSSSKYLNEIDRINNEYFDPDALKELQTLVNKWRNDISSLEINIVEQRTTEEKMSSTTQIENFSDDTKCEFEDSGPKDIYDNNSVMDTLSEMEDIIAIADENKMDMNEQAKRRQVKIKVLEESIVSIEKKNQLKGRKEETKRDPLFHNTENSSDETDAHLHTLEESENELKKEKLQIEKGYHDYHIHECKARYKEEMESHKKEFDELISYEKVNYDFKLKQLEEKFKCEIELNSMSGGGGIPTSEEITNQFEKERETIEKQFLDSTEALNKELEKRFQILGKLIKQKEGGFN